MEIKIIGKSVVPDKILLYENDLGANSLVFSSSKVNDGINLEVLNAYLEIEREEGVSDRLLLDKTIVEEVVYFTLPINLALTENSDLLSSQIVFENNEKTLSYRTKVFYIDVKNSVDGVSSYEQLAPTVISQLESKFNKAVTDCETIKSEIELTKDEFESNVEETSSKIKEEVLSQLGDVIADDFLSTESKNPVQNKIVTEKINEITIKVDDTLSTESENPVQNKVITEALDGCVKKYTGTPNTYVKLYGQKQSTGEEAVFEAIYGCANNKIHISGRSSKGGYDDDGNIVSYANGALYTAIPEKPAHATPKKWVEDLVNDNKGTKIYKHTITGQVYTRPEDGNTYDIYVEFYSFNDNTNNASMYYEPEEYTIVAILINPEGIIAPPYGTITQVEPNSFDMGFYLSSSFGGLKYVGSANSSTDWGGICTGYNFEEEVVGV